MKFGSDLDRGSLSQPTKMRLRNLFFMMAIAREAASCKQHKAQNFKMQNTYTYTLTY